MGCHPSHWLIFFKMVKTTKSAIDSLLKFPFRFRFFPQVEVVKKRKLTKTSDLRISATGRPGLSPEILQQRQDEETQMQAEMREIIETDERKNDLEGHLAEILADGGTVVELFIDGIVDAIFLGGECWLCSLRNVSFINGACLFLFFRNHECDTWNGDILYISNTCTCGGKSWIFTPKDWWAHP